MAGKNKWCMVGSPWPAILVVGGLALLILFGVLRQIGQENSGSGKAKKPNSISVTARCFDRTPATEYGSAVDFLGKKKHWMFKFEFYSEEGNSFDSKEYLKRFPEDAVWKSYSGDGQTGVKIFTNNSGEKVRDGWIKVKSNCDK